MDFFLDLEVELSFLPFFEVGFKLSRPGPVLDVRVTLLKAHLAPKQNIEMLDSIVFMMEHLVLKNLLVAHTPNNLHIVLVLQLVKLFEDWLSP